MALDKPTEVSGNKRIVRIIAFALVIFVGYLIVSSFFNSGNRVNIDEEKNTPTAPTTEKNNSLFTKNNILFSLLLISGGVIIYLLFRKQKSVFQDDMLPALPMKQFQDDIIRQHLLEGDINGVLDGEGNIIRYSKSQISFPNKVLWVEGNRPFVSMMKKLSVLGGSDNGEHTIKFDRSNAGSIVNDDIDLFSHNNNPKYMPTLNPDIKKFPKVRLIDKEERKLKLAADLLEEDHESSNKDSFISNLLQTQPKQETRQQINKQFEGEET